MARRCSLCSSSTLCASRTFDAATAMIAMDAMIGSFVGAADIPVSTHTRAKRASSACPHKSAFCKRGSVNVRFAPKATEVLRCRELTRCAISRQGARLGCLADYQGRLGGEYGSGVPSWIGGYFFRLSENSATIFVTGATTHELCQTTSSRCSFKSVRRLMTFGSGRVTAGSYMFTCQIKCTFQFRHLTADNRSAT